MQHFERIFKCEEAIHQKYLWYNDATFLILMPINSDCGDLQPLA